MRRHGSNSAAAFDSTRPPDADTDTDTDTDRVAETGSLSAEHHRVASSMAPRLANGIVAAVFCGFGITACINVVLTGGGTLDLLLSIGYVAVLLALQFGVISGPAQRHRPMVGRLAVLAQACLVYLPMLHLEEAWVGLPGFLAGSVLLTFPRAVAWPLFLAVVASMGWIAYAMQDRSMIIAYTVVATSITGLVIYGLTRLAQLVTAMHAARDDLARLAVADERLRFARDVHDLLGFSLSAIALKTELTSKLMSRDTGRAREELAEVLQISRQAIADARAVASGHGALTLEDALRTAESTLQAANVRLRVSQDHARLSQAMDTLLATILREGVTNLLRHSKAEWCEVTIVSDETDLRIDIRNDGVDQGRSHMSTPRTVLSGNGVSNLAHRVEMLGGKLTAGGEGDGEFRLHAAIPLSH